MKKIFILPKSLKLANLEQTTAYILIIAAIATGVITRLVSLKRYTTFDIGSAPDQLRDAFVYMKMLAGNFPTLGPESSVGDYSLPPLYYYLTFPSTWLGADPSLQVIPNGLCSMLAIPLFMVLLYELLEGPLASRRLLLAGLGGFWYSLIFADVFISTFEWNPSPIPCFLFTFLLLGKRLFQSQKSLWVQALQWVAYGINLAILVSLHSTTLFIMPIIFIGSLLVFAVRYRTQPQRLWLPSLAVFSAAIALAPYWLGEFSRGWVNTRKIIALASGSTPDQSSNSEFFLRLSRMAFNYLELGQQTFFTNFPWFYSVGIVFLGLVLVVGLTKFRGNRYLLISLLAVSLIYLYAASRYDTKYSFHYKMLFFFVPIILTMLSLAYSDRYPLLIRRALRSFIAVSLVLSCLSNLHFNYLYLDSKFGQNKVIAIADIIDILQTLPLDSGICDPRYVRWRQHYHVVHYIDSYMMHKNFSLSAVCHVGDYLIYPKRLYKFWDSNRWPQFEIVPNQPFDKAARLITDTSTVAVYAMERQYDLDECYSFVVKEKSCFYHNGNSNHIPLAPAPLI